MKIREIRDFGISHEGLAWPWLAFSPRGDRVACTNGARFETHTLEGPRTSFALAFPLADLRGFAVHPDGHRIAFHVAADGAHHIISVDEAGERLRTTLPAELTPGGITFDRKGKHLWVVAESEKETVFLLLDAETHAVLGESRSPALPRPTTHELYTHPVDDAVLLVAACGEEGTFARVVGWSGEKVEQIESALDAGAVSAGFVGFSNDAARVHLVEADELRTHAWPTLTELSTVELADDFISSFSGAVMGDFVLVDGQSADDGDDLVMRFDQSAIRGVVLNPPFPTGMWAGRLGSDVLVTIDPKASKATFVRIELPSGHN